MGRLCSIYGYLSQNAIMGVKEGPGPTLGSAKLAERANTSTPCLTRVTPAVLGWRALYFRPIKFAIALVMLHV